MSNREHRAAYDRIAREVDGALRGRHVLAEQVKSALARELSALLETDAALRRELEQLRQREAALMEALQATQEALATVAKERDAARADIQRLGRGLIGLPLDEDGEIVVWN